MSYTIDATDRRIVQLLQSDGKMTIKEIANELKMTNTPVFERIKRLEREGYILGYTAILDRGKFGNDLVAFCSVALERHEKRYINQFVKDVDELNEVGECYHVAGMFDYLLKIHVKDMNDYHEFISQKLVSIKNIGRIQSFFVLTELKNKKVLPL